MDSACTSNDLSSKKATWKPLFAPSCLMPRSGWNRKRGFFSFVLSELSLFGNLAFSYIGQRLSSPPLERRRAARATPTRIPMRTAQWGVAGGIIASLRVRRRRRGRIRTANGVSYLGWRATEAGKASNQPRIGGRQVMSYQGLRADFSELGPRSHEKTKSS